MPLVGARLTVTVYLTAHDLVDDIDSEIPSPAVNIQAPALR
jgi:hypothetical protein